MKSNKIELVKDYDEFGNILDSEIYVTPFNIKLEIVYECVDALSKIENEEEGCDIHTISDLVVRIYNNQFTKQELLKGLDAVSMNIELVEQIYFIGSGQGYDTKTNTSAREDNNTWEDNKNNLKKFVKEMMKQGKDINNLMEMPFSFFMEVVQDENDKKVEHKESMIDAFM